MIIDVVVVVVTRPNCCCTGFFYKNLFYMNHQPQKLPKMAHKFLIFSAVFAIEGLSKQLLYKQLAKQLQ